jgi:hypothetical protein
MQKQSHAHISALEIGKTYTCTLNDAPLYDAVVEKAQGCWATVKIVQPLPGKYEKQYSAGQTFDIKVQYYDFVEKTG